MLKHIKRLLVVATASGVAAQIQIPRALADTASIQVESALEQGVLLAGSSNRTVHLRIGIKGLANTRRESRPPMNIALVIDRSGSMQGARIQAARDAALLALDRLTSRDIVSVISYDDRAEVEVPATRASDTNAIKDRIRKITARGSTAIWAGMQSGAAEIRKFKSPNHVNKIILLSDGIANVGPKEPEDFARLGQQLAGEGITVSTIGLGDGYNEDLMSKLAINADGTHKFVAEPADLARFFDLEFNDALGVVAQDIEIRIQCAPGVKPMRSLGRSAAIAGDQMTFRVNQIISGSEQVLLAALQPPVDLALGVHDLARIEVVYRGTDEASAVTEKRIVQARVSASDSEVTSSMNASVLRDVSVLTAREIRQEAIRLQDAGRQQDAQQKLQEATTYLKARQAAVPGAATYEPLQRELRANEAATSEKGKANWNTSRKQLRELDTNSGGASIRF